MFYKKRASHKSLLPEKNALVIITRKLQDKPKLLRPEKQKRVTDLRNLLQKSMVRMDADEMETWEKFVMEWERIIDIWRTIPRSFQQRLKAVRRAGPSIPCSTGKSKRVKLSEEAERRGRELRKLLDRETYTLEVSFQPCRLLFSCEYNFYLVSKFSMCIGIIYISSRIGTVRTDCRNDTFMLY